ncbi:MAG: hypothetical protein F6K03_10295, partial [Kamptonema sp. SIO4C4]|nr:hypothetical protein [Kamptonema sp. SIO4C4]
MDQPQFFIHIGLQKTASTFLQEKIFPLFSELTLVTRPFTSQNQAFNKLNKANDLLYDKQEIIDVIQFIQNKEQKSKILLSDESFAGKALYYHYINRTLIAYR